MNVKTNLPLVTIITPTYNRADFLDETIQSVLQQDYPNIEYIVLDDGSKDNTQEVLSKYGDHLYWETHPNMGETQTVNKGIQMAKGTVICVVNSDDPILPGAVSTAVQYLQKYPKALAAYPDWLEIDFNSAPIHEHQLPDYTLWSMLRDFNVAIGPGTFIRRKAFEIAGMRDTSFKFVGDLEFWFRMAAYDGLIHIPHTIATHRTHPTSASSSAKGARMADELVRMTKKVFANRAVPKWAYKLRNYSISIAHHDAVHYCGSNKWLEYQHRIASFFYSPAAYIYRSAYGVDTPLRSRICRRLWSTLTKFGVSLPQPPEAIALNQQNETTNQPAKFGFVSHVQPPSWSGQAVVIERLLSQINPDNYCLISLRDYKEASPEENNRRLTGPYYVLPKEPEKYSTSRYTVLRWASSIYRILTRGFAIAKVARAEHCQVILAGTGEPIDLPATYFASWLLGVHFIPYLFDDYTYQWTDPITRSIAVWAEKIMFPHAAKVIVPNEFLRDEIFKRHGVVSVIVRNPSEDIKSYPNAASSLHRDQVDEVKVVYTGAVYHVNFGAFRNTISAIKQIGSSSYKLHLYTAQSIPWLESEGVCGAAVIFHQHVPPDEVAKAQVNASMLLIPFSFNSTVPEIIKTSAPGKLGDYLASGTPILAHVPPDSFVSWYLKKHRCGLVVDQEDPDALAKAISLLSEDADTIQEVVHNALSRAELDFHPQASRETFLRVLELLK